MTGLSESSAAIDQGVPVSDDLCTVAASNEQAFARILRLYARPGQVIADPTYGNGRFWRDVDTGQYTVLLTDMSRDGVDLRKLPYGDDSIDMTVLDPPYRYTPVANVPQDKASGHGRVDGLYNLSAAKLTNTEAVIQLYVAGFGEALRVLRRGGFLVVKCQDTVQDGKQIWVHVRLMTEAQGLGFACRDISIVAPPRVLHTRWDRQRHLRKAHSYFLVFRKGGHFPFGMPPTMPRKAAAAAEAKCESQASLFDLNAAS